MVQELYFSKLGHSFLLLAIYKRKITTHHLSGKRLRVKQVFDIGPRLKGFLACQSRMIQNGHDCRFNRFGR